MTFSFDLVYDYLKIIYYRLFTLVLKSPKWGVAIYVYTNNVYIDRWLYESIMSQKWKLRKELLSLR